VARTPETVSINLHELMLLLNYKWACVNSERVGELGTETYEDFLGGLNARCTIEITPRQLEELLFTLKEGVVNRVQPAKLKFTIRNYNGVMKKLKRQLPHMFKELPSGEVSMVELEDRFYE
jgi:uncharacterized protein with NAD-binding domain and iron-sulfur cluster